MKTRRRIVSILLAAIMVISGIPSMVFADNTSNFNYLGSKKASPTTLGQDRKTTVTFSLPSSEYKNEIDIVFAMDSSSSAKNSTVFINSVTSLFDSILSNNENLTLNVGVVRFRGRAHDAVKYLSNGTYSGLTEYNDDSKQYIEGALTMTEDEVKAAFGNGSNTHAGIDIADEWLSADNDLKDNQKYLVLLTDGKTYMWNNEKNEPTTIYSQYYRWERGNDKGAGVIQASGRPALSQTAGYNKKSYSLDVLDKNGKSNIFWFPTYEALYKSQSDELKGETKWDQPCYYADDKSKVPSGDVTKHDVTNGAELFGSDSATYGFYRDYQYYYEFAPNELWKDVPYLEANPFAVIVNGDGPNATYTFDTETINPNYYQYHADCLQKGMYKAGHLWSDVNKKYNTAAITYRGGSTGGGLELVYPFLDWLETNSDYGADITKSDEVEALFSDIDNSIRYMVGRGVVTDKVANEFTMVMPSDGAVPLKMTKDGKELKSSSAGDNKWNFGEAADGVYPYVAEYDESSKTIKWTINVPVENKNKITLSYDLVLGDEYPPGTYETNESAVLAYTSSDGEHEGEYPFEKPQVTYSKPAPTPANYTLTINYVYANGRTAATSYRSTLKAGASYGPINSPAINGYRADRASVSGVMPEGDVTYTVVYRRTGGGNPPNNPGGPVVTPGDGQTTPPTIPDEPTPTTEPPTTDIVDPEPPLAAGAWALINLICAILTALGAIIALFRRKEEEDEDEDEAQNAYKAEDEEEEDDNRGKKMLAAKAAGVLAGVAAPITFFLTEDMSLPMQLTDKWTLLMAVILAVQIVAATFNKKASELDDDEEETAEEAAN